MRTLTFALYFGNRGFFPGELIAAARRELTAAVEAAGHRWIALDGDATRNGGVETPAEGRLYADFLRAHAGEYDGVILSLPNFGDENGAIAALRDCGVPILIQAYPDEIGKMDFEHRRDSFCGKFSIMDVFYQYGLKFTVFAPHTCRPDSPEFADQLAKFAGVCRVVGGMKRFTMGAIGARTTKFKTVRWDELALQKYGVTVDTYDLAELFSRIRRMPGDRPELAEKKRALREYADFSAVPEGKLDTLARMAAAVDDMIREYGLDAVSLRCWEEMQQEGDIGVAPCVLLGELNNRLIAASCEMDVNNGVAMRALALASGEPAACLDWNNNYGDDPDKCILFHCGPVPEALMAGRGRVGNHKMFTKAGDPDCGWGADEGRLAPMVFTYASARTENGKLHVYTGTGEITADPIEDAFFGCGGVARIPNLQEKLMYIGKQGYRHHTVLTRGDCLTALNEALGNYLGYELEPLDSMRLVEGRAF